MEALIPSILFLLSALTLIYIMTALKRKGLKKGENHLSVSFLFFIVVKYWFAVDRNLNLFLGTGH